MATEAPFPWHLGLYDAHCHAYAHSHAQQPSTLTLSATQTSVLTIMATRSEDQSLIAALASEFPVHLPSTAGLDRQRVIPAFGWHPWFSYQLYDAARFDGKQTLGADEKIAHYRAVLSPAPVEDTLLDALPELIPLQQFLDETERYLERFPRALVGEIGLDKAFRLPNSWFAGSEGSKSEVRNEGRTLSPYRVSLEHQRWVLEEQLRLAGRMQRPVSVHGVQAHGQLFEVISKLWRGFERPKQSKRAAKRARQALLDAYGADEDSDEDGKAQKQQQNAGGQRPFPPRICLHSYSGSAPALEQYFVDTVPADVYVSFSECVNFGSDSLKAEDSIVAAPDDRILVESDLHTWRDAIDPEIEAITRRICRLKEWELYDGVARLGNNWKRFVFGNEAIGHS